ncbi:MAG TPA: transposase [Candidatus Acidoferrales bacterium]|nr:transposase [Candidatus Acidoferrales bacterium]
MPKGLKRIYGFGHLHFITFSCYRRLPRLGSARARTIFVRVLAEVRDRCGFKLVGYVVMPEHVHLLISEPQMGTPSTVVQLLKQRASRRLRTHRRKRTPQAQLRLWQESLEAKQSALWQRRFYDFNVWSRKKKIEELAYMHMNPVKRGLVRRPDHWLWSSCKFYQRQEGILIRIDPVG